MKNIEDINKAAIQKITANKKITEISPGDTIKVGVKIVEGKRERIQYFEGVCIAKKNRDLNSKLVRRRGRVYIINKKNPKFKARQK